VYRHIIRDWRCATFSSSNWHLLRFGCCTGGAPRLAQKKPYGRANLSGFRSPQLLARRGANITYTRCANGNGRCDILFQNTNGTVAIWQMNGADVAAHSPDIGNPVTSWRVVVTGDFHGDGHSDILFQNTNRGDREFLEGI
jgi:hypothetical protein